MAYGRLSHGTEVEKRMVRSIYKGTEKLERKPRENKFNTKYFVNIGEPEVVKVLISTGFAFQKGV